jgi:hypothetical protein
MMTDHNVTLVEDSMLEFKVDFHGMSLDHVGTVLVSFSVCLSLIMARFSPRG